MPWRLSDNTYHTHMVSMSSYYLATKNLLVSYSQIDKLCSPFAHLAQAPQFILDSHNMYTMF